MNDYINIYFLIDVPAGALNMGEADSTRDNLILVKKLRTSKGLVPYVSAQSFRYWLRCTLEEDFNWELSPATGPSTKQAYTDADPIKYPDDDIFGYMRAVSKADTKTRISPLKVSTLISLNRSTKSITEDFGVFARHKDGTPILHSHEIFSGILQGFISISPQDVGIFNVSKKTGFQNFLDNEVLSLIESDAITEISEGLYALSDNDKRKKRLIDPILALKNLHGGANQTLHLTDLSPKFIILCQHKGGNYYFSNITKENKSGDQIPSQSSLLEILEDYKDQLITNIYIGLREGFLEELYEELKTLDGTEIGNKKIKFGSPIAAIDGFIEELKNLKDLF